ncbi:unnamed protein product [Ambrosiozyma monospora]|uniref:Unnamed protein product n=1 Tax=Ambrosiozyma monospora TaxID=43982 RepID=A0A9W6Z3F1_AMBMO|nr:unnamed protein product [Ambrosiozyma monospora]
MISHDQAQSLQALVDPSWDQQVLKSGWVNKIDENDSNTEPDLRFLRAELKGSMFYLYRPPQELQQVKHFEPENEKQTASPNDSSEFLPLARMATQNPSRNDLDHDKPRRPTIPELDADLQSRKTSQSSFTLAYDQDDNRSLRSRTAISVNLREFPEFDNSSFTMDELSYASDAYPHPDLVLDEDIGMILTGTLESICHTILFNPSSKIASKLIKILPLVDHLLKALSYFQKYIETFVEANSSSEALGETYGTVPISREQYNQMNDRLVLVFDTICSKFPGMLLEEDILKSIWHLLILLDGRKNCDDLKLKIHKLQLELTRLVENDKSDLGHVSHMLSFEGMFSHDLKDIAREMNAISLKFSNVWDARIDVSLQYQTVQDNYFYWKKNPLVFSPINNVHYLGRLLCYQLFHDSKFSVSPESRAVVLTKWIELGSMLADLGDMISWLAIATTICSMPILRLSRTWSYIDPALIRSMSKQWAPVVFELDRRSMVSTSSHRSSSHILVPNGIGERYCKENAVPFFGDLFVAKVDDDGNLVKECCKMSDIVKNSLEKWDKYFAKVENSESLSLTENIHHLSGTFSLDIQKRLRTALTYHTDLPPLTNENIMEESLLVEKSYASQFNKYHNTSRSPLFLGSYPSILFPKVLSSYSIYDQESLVGALGAVTTPQNLNQNSATTQGNLIKDSLSTDNLAAHRKTGRNQFLRSVRDLFNIDSKEFHFSDSIIFKTMEYIAQQELKEDHSSTPKLPSASSSQSGARSRPSSILFSENSNVKRYSSYSTNSFTLEDYVHYQEYMKDNQNPISPVAPKPKRDVKKDEGKVTGAVGPSDKDMPKIESSALGVPQAQDAPPISPLPPVHDGDLSHDSEAEDRR